MGDVEPDPEPDFAHLLPRDAEVATFLHHLPNGAAMGYKALAAAHPRYGQQAIRTSVRRLIEAGHLRWVKEHITVEDNSMRWVDQDVLVQGAQDPGVVGRVRTRAARAGGNRRLPVGAGQGDRAGAATDRTPGR
ncbi:hypothetical protein [Streptomyces venezuelae]|uniref:hypothetical protein n=1 Tax=Streptomyces venezuelae TaxID=54571 RepID=UPI00343C052B